MNNQTKGILWFLFACFNFAGMASVLKHVTSFETTMEMLLVLRNLLAVIILMAYVGLRKAKPKPKIINKKFFFARCTVGTIAMLLMFYSFKHLSVTDWVALSFLIPIFASIGAVIFLGEHIGWHRRIAILVGFLGAMVIIKPGFEEVGIGVYISIIFCMCTASVLVMVKKLSSSEDGFSMMYYMHVYMLIMSAPLVIFFWSDVSWPMIYWSGLIALFSIFAHYALIKSYTYIDLSMTAPFEFSRIIMASIIAYIFLGELPEANSYIGAAIIVLSTTYIAHREVMCKKRAKA